MNKVIDYLDENPKIAKLNRDCIQLDLEGNIKEEIENNYHKNFQKIETIKHEIYSGKTKLGKKI